MYNEHQSDELALKQLFNKFVDAGLNGRFEEALDLISEPYTGIGMGEQGIVQSKEQAESVLCGGYRSTDNKIDYEVENTMVNFLNTDAAVVFGKVNITNTPKNGKPMHSGLMQTVGARRNNGQWQVAFTHASPITMTVESIEAYPLSFMDHTISLLKADLQAENILYAEVNLSKNIVLRIECKTREWPEINGINTLENAVKYCACGKLDKDAEREYYAFWDRTRLIGLFSEGVTKDQFDYSMRTDTGVIRLRATIEMAKQAYSGDIIAVISYARLDTINLDINQYAHKVYHDALTDILNREGFEIRAAELLYDYDPQKNTALFMVDLDDFKQINDRLGHQVGDLVLCQVAKSLQTTFQSGDAVGRIGGDEFMVMLSGKFSANFLEKKAERLLQSMNLSIGGSKQIPVSVSIGIAYGRGYMTFDKLYNTADVAMYRAKKAGKCRYHVINVDTNAEHGTDKETEFISLQELINSNELSIGKTPYEALIESIPGSVLVISLSDKVRIKHCNDWTSHFTGYSMEEIEELQQNDILELVHPDDRVQINELIPKMYNGLDVMHIVYRIRRKDGTYAHVQLDATMTERTKNEIVFHGIQTDIEEVFKLKQAIESAHNDLETLFNTIPGGVLIISLKETISFVHCNEWVSRFLGYEIEEINNIENNNPLALVHPEDLPQLKTAIEDMRAGATTINVVYRLLDKANAYQKVRIIASLTEKRPDESIYYGIVTNV